MQTDHTVLTAEQTALLLQLEQSRAQILSRADAGRLDTAQLHQLANDIANLTTRLLPLPLDPGEDLLAAHTYARTHLERLPQHDPARIVVADETHSYTPRKIVRRVLDHALDHLNQIEQWLLWQQKGTIPTPTDGWASSEETFPEDLQPISQAELQAWLWRIDLAIAMVAQRAKQLSAEQLDWVSPDGGWSLRQMFRHLALAEAYYAVWLDEALPDEALARYREASERFEQRLRQVFRVPATAQIAFFWHEDYTPVTAEQLAEMLLTKEQQFLNGRAE